MSNTNTTQKAPSHWILPNELMVSIWQLLNELPAKNTRNLLNLMDQQMKPFEMGEDKQGVTEAEPKKEKK